MSPYDIEQLIDRELRALPSPRAPRTLLPRVMESVRTGQPSPSAPMWPRLVFLAAALAAIAAVPWLLGSSVVLERLAVVVEATSFVNALMQVVWRALLEPIVSYASLLLLFIACLGAALWKAIRFVALEPEGASHS